MDMPFKQICKATKKVIVLVNHFMILIKLGLIFNNQFNSNRDY